jgi:hypothetical protein
MVGGDDLCSPLYGYNVVVEDAPGKITRKKTTTAPAIMIMMTITMVMIEVIALLSRVEGILSTMAMTQ